MMFAPERLLSTLIYLAATIAVFVTAFKVSLQSGEERRIDGLFVCLLVWWLRLL